MWLGPLFTSFNAQLVDAAVPDLMTDAFGGFRDKRRNRPVTCTPADIEGEIPQDLESPIRVCDFGVKEQRVQLTARVFHRGNGRVGARRRHRETGRSRRHENWEAEQRKVAARVQSLP
jgi:hypothetical protein